MDLNEKVVAITGGAQGLGLSMARAFAARGAKLALIDINNDVLERAKAELTEAGASVATFTTNVADEESVTQTFSAIIDTFGQLNGLINNAGITRDGLMLKVKDGEIVDRMSLAQWQLVIDVNLTGSFLCGREAADPDDQNRIRGGHRQYFQHFKGWEHGPNQLFRDQSGCGGHDRLLGQGAGSLQYSYRGDCARFYGHGDGHEYETRGAGEDVGGNPS